MVSHHELDRGRTSQQQAQGGVAACCRAGVGQEWVSFLFLVPLLPSSILGSAVALSPGRAKPGKWPVPAGPPGTSSPGNE